MELQKGIESLRAVRFYLDQPIPEEIVEKILNAGRATGSGKNFQWWRFIVIRDRERLTKLAECGNWAGHLATCAMAIAVVMEKNSFAYDGGRASQNMMLTAHDLGVGTCPISVQPALANPILRIPEGSQIAIIMSLGYADTAKKAEEKHFRDTVLSQQGRRPLSDIVLEETFDGAGYGKSETA